MAAINILERQLNSLLINEAKLFKLISTNTPEEYTYQFTLPMNNKHFIINKYSNHYNITEWNDTWTKYQYYLFDTYETVFQQLISQVKACIKNKVFL